MASVLVSVEGLGYTRTSTDEALADISLTVYGGEVLALLGGPGAGQSELLDLLAGALTPTTGRVLRHGPPAGLRLIHDPALTPLQRVELRRDAAGGKAVVVATTRVATAHALSDRVVLLHEGRLRAIRPASDLAPLLGSEHYRIRLRGHLEPRAAQWFDGLRLESTATGETILAGPLADQATLHGYLARIRDLGLVLLEVLRCEPPLHSLFDH